MNNNPWKCPRCKKINAPFIPFCDCKPNDFNKKPWNNNIGVNWQQDQSEKCLICHGNHIKGVSCISLKIT